MRKAVDGHSMPAIDQSCVPNISRRSLTFGLVAGLAASTAVAGGAVAARVAHGAPAAGAPHVVTASLVHPDIELIRLWAHYRQELAAYREAKAVYAPRRAALDRDMETFRIEYEQRREEFRTGPGWQDWFDRERTAFKKGWRKHKLGGPRRTMDKHENKCADIIAAIRRSEAQTVSGIGIKLAALPPDIECCDTEDFMGALRSAIHDVCRLCDVDFSAMAVKG